MTTPHVISGQVGIDLTVTTAGTTTNGVDAKFVLGTIVNASDGNAYIYVQANGAITQYDTVWIGVDHQAAAITAALAATAGRPGFAQIAFADNEFGWVVIHGTSFRIRFAASCVKDVPLYTTDTAGVLDDATASASHYQVLGVIIKSVSGTTASNAEASGAFPGIRRPVA